MSNAEQALADAMTARWGTTLGRFDRQDAQDVLGFLKGYRLEAADKARTAPSGEHDAQLLALREALGNLARVVNAHIGTFPIAAKEAIHGPLNAAAVAYKSHGPAAEEVKRRIEEKARAEERLRIVEARKTNECPICGSYVLRGHKNTLTHRRARALLEGQTR